MHPFKLKIYQYSFPRRQGPFLKIFKRSTITNRRGPIIENKTITLITAVDLVVGKDHWFFQFHKFSLFGAPIWILLFGKHNGPNKSFISGTGVLNIP